MTATKTTGQPMTDNELATWFELRGVRAAQIAAMVAEHRGQTRSEMDDMYDEICGPTA